MRKIPMCDRRIRLILVKAPDLCLLTKHQMVGIKAVYLQTNIVERLEAKIFFNIDGVSFLSINGSTLYKQAVAMMLEVSKYLCGMGVAQRDNRSRKTDIHAVRPS